MFIIGVRGGWNDIHTHMQIHSHKHKEDMQRVILCIHFHKWSYHVLIFYCCITNYHKVRVLKPIPIYYLTVLSFRYWADHNCILWSEFHNINIKMPIKLYSFLELWVPLQTCKVVGTIQFHVFVTLKPVLSYWLLIKSSLSGLRCHPHFPSLASV